MTENPYVKEHLGDLALDEAKSIAAHLRFLGRLEGVLELKNEKPEYEPEDLAKRLEWLIHRAERRQAINDLAAGQCDGTLNGERCWLTLGHEGEHEGRENELSRTTT